MDQTLKLCFLVIRCVLCTMYYTYAYDTLCILKVYIITYYIHTFIQVGVKSQKVGPHDGGKK